MMAVLGHGHSHSGGGGHGHSHEERRDHGHSPGCHGDHTQANRHRHESNGSCHGGDMELNHRTLTAGEMSNGSPTERRSSMFENINMRAAFIHVIGDLIQSVGVVIAGYIIKFWVSVV